uniref:Uncharacterized protein n=1 Tax=Triticum urartu TaxID=4572 RepID=A0A8R7R3S8_TRIUA
VVAVHQSIPRPPSSLRLVFMPTNFAIARYPVQCEALEPGSSASRDRRRLLPLRSPVSSSIPAKPAAPK